MKKKHSLSILVVFISFFVPINATNYYVATNEPNASDGNNGTSLSTPFKTIQKAATVSVAGDVVYIRAGMYREIVRPTNSGTANARIVYQSYNGEVVTITGTDVLTGWTLHQDNIYKTTMPADFLTNSHNQSDQLFVDGQMMPLARWPNNTNLNPSYPSKATFTTFVSKVPETNGTYTSKFTDSNLPQTVDLVGAEIYIQPNFEAWSWVFTGKVTDVSGTQVTLNTVNGSGKDGGTNYDPKSRYFLFNKLSLLDTPGEWYHDMATNTLYLWCPGNADPSTVKVEAKKREFAFDLSDRSYITLKDLKIVASTITTDAQAGGDNKSTSPNANPYYPWRGRTFTAAATGIKLDGIDATYISHYTDLSGHFFLQWGLSSGIVISGTNHEVRNCRVQYSAGNGFAVNGKGHKIINNVITDINYMANDAAGINTAQPGYVYDVEMAYNTIQRTGRSGITPRSLVNSTVNQFIARIHHNEMSEYMIQDWDGGAVYSATGNHGFIRVDHNTCHNSSNGFLNSGVYFDWSANVIVDHNVIWNNDWPLHFQAYGDNTKNNTLCYNNTTLARNAGNKSFGPFNIENSIGSNQGTLIQNNILVFADGLNTSAPATYSPIDATGFTSATKITNFLHAAGSPGFVDLANADLQLKNSSPCIDAGTLVTETKMDAWTIPAFNDRINGKTDIGAYEFGNEKFATGANLSPDNEAPTTPVDLTSEKVVSDKLFLKWKPSNDNVGITAYYIYKNGVLVGYTENLFFQVTGLSASTAYQFGVKAVDYRGNLSQAAALSVSTSTIDTTPPSAPFNLRVEDVSLTGFKAVWTASTDNNFVEKYDVKINGSSKGIVMHPDSTLTINALAANTLYQLSVTAFDGTGNATISDTVDVKTGNGALISYESFKYEAGTLNPDADGTTNGYGFPASNFEITGVGLRGNWGLKSQTLPGSLMYSDAQQKTLLTNANSLAIENGLLSRSIYVYTGLTADPFGGLRTPTTDFGVNGTEIWTSVLMNISDIGNDFRFVFRSVSGKNQFSVGLKNQQWCIIDSTLNQIGGVVATANKTALLLVKVTFGTIGIASRDDKVELWVNPSLTGNLPVADAVYPNMVGNFSRFGTNNLLLATDPSICTIDELRIGLQKEDVTPLGIPSALPINENPSIYVYPTLAKDQIHVVGMSGYNLRLLNVEGKVLKTMKIQSSNSVIDVSSFSKGIYFLHASGTTGQRFFKVMVQ